MPLSDRDILELVDRYRFERQGFERVAAEVVRIMADRLSERAIRNIPTWRAKRPESFERKFRRREERDTRSMADFSAGLSPPLKDLAAARFLLYQEKDVESATAAIREVFQTDRWPPKTHRTSGGYSADHLFVDLSRVHGQESDFTDVRYVPCEVQICSITSHIWNELEHDIRYKQPDGEPDEAQHELLGSLHRELQLAAQGVVHLMTRTEKRRAKNLLGISSAESLRIYLENRLARPVAGDFAGLLSLLSRLRDPLTPATLDNLRAEGLQQQRVDAVVAQFDPDGAQLDVGPIAVAMLQPLGIQEVLAFFESTTEVRPLWRFLQRVVTQLQAD